MNRISNLRKAQLKQNIPFYWMLLPGFIATFIFNYLPIFGIVIAFKRFSPAQGIFGSPWAGFDNFKYLFRNAETWTVLRNTIGYNIIFIGLGMVMNVCLAILLSQVAGKLAKKVYQTILIMPHFLSMVIVAYIVYAFLSPENGFLNTAILGPLGIDPINWYVNPKPWPYILSIVHFWKVCGWGSVMYLAAIAGIDTSLYEAAEIDGANRWQKIWYITLPSIKTIIIIKLIMDVGKIFNSDFGLFYQVPMNSGALYPVTNTMDLFVYNTMGQGGIAGTGMSAATSLFKSVVGFCLVMITNSIVRKVDNDNAMF